MPLKRCKFLLRQKFFPYRFEGEKEEEKGRREEEEEEEERKRRVILNINMK
jgi:hypothetical protein